MTQFLDRPDIGIAEWEICPRLLVDGRQERDGVWVLVDSGGSRQYPIGVFGSARNLTRDEARDLAEALKAAVTWHEKHCGGAQ